MIQSSIYVVHNCSFRMNSRMRNRCQLLELCPNFVIRLQKGTYKEEINNMKFNYEIIRLKLTDERLVKFHDTELKAKYEKLDYIKLRIVKTKVKVIRIDKKQVKNTKTK